MSNGDTRDGPIRVAVVGGESTGKSTLARALAARLGGALVPEFARDYLLDRGDAAYPIEESMAIARGQVERERAVIEAAGPGCGLVVCDSDAMSTVLWSWFYFERVLPELEALAEANKHDAYLLCAADLPWEDDGLRRSEGSGAWFERRFVETLERWGRPWLRVEGPVDRRVTTATAWLGERGLRLEPR